MVVLKHRKDFPDRIVEPLEVRRKRHSEEGARRLRIIRSRSGRCSSGWWRYDGNALRNLLRAAVAKFS